MGEASRITKASRVNINKQADVIQAFIRSLPVDREGCVLELDGKPLLRVVPITDAPVSSAKLKAAILSRRDESRRLNKEWEAVDREMWEKLP
jgi:hypothetical protein